MIVSLMILFIAFLAIFQDDKRRLAALIFALLMLVHEVFCQQLPGYLYFFTAALIDISAMAIIINLKYTTRLTENLVHICMGFILLNTLGWINWEIGIIPEAYVVGAAILYMCVIVSLLNWDGIEDGNYKINRWLNIFRLFDNSCAHHISGLSKEG